MLKRTLGSTGLDVTVLGYGAMALSPAVTDPASVSDDQAGRILNKVLDAGVNFIDTAPDYGLSEERIGKFIAHRRGEYFLATKCGCNVPREDSNVPGHIWSRDRLMGNIELSLQRMRTDAVDIWQLHNPSVEEVEKGDLVRAMEDVRQQGKVRHVSISSTLPHIRTYIEKGWFATYQIPYSALETPEEQSITAAAEAGAGTIIRGGVGRGEPSGDFAGDRRWTIWEEAKLDEFCAAGESRCAFLLRYTITHPHLHTTIVGTANDQHLAENLQAVEYGPLPAAVYDHVKQCLAGVTKEQ